MVSFLTRVEDYLHSEIKRGMIKKGASGVPTPRAGLGLGDGVGAAGGEGARYANNGEIMYNCSEGCVLCDSGVGIIYVWA